MMFSSSLLVTITTRCYLLDALQCLQSAQARHLLIEEHQVERPFTAQVDGIGAVAGASHLVAFFLQEDDVGLQQFHLIVYP